MATSVSDTLRMRENMVTRLSSHFPMLLKRNHSSLLNFSEHPVSFSWQNASCKETKNSTSIIATATQDEHCSVWLEERLSTMQMATVLHSHFRPIGPNTPLTPGILQALKCENASGQIFDIPKTPLILGMHLVWSLSIWRSKTSRQTTHT